METLKLFFVIYFFVIFGGNVNAQGTTHMVLEHSYTCTDVTKQKINFYINPKDFNPGFQLVDINMTIPTAVGYEALGTAILDYNAHSAGNETWIHIITLQNDLCTMFERYMGDFWHDVQTAMGMMRSSCPLPRGTYHANSYQLDFHKLKFQTFAIGITRARLEIRVKDEILFCKSFILSNVRRI